MAAALSFLDSTSDIFRQLNLLDQDTLILPTTNMEDTIVDVDEPLVVPDTPDRVSGNNNVKGSNDFLLEEVDDMNINQDKRMFLSEEVDDMQGCFQTDGKIPKEKQGKEVRIRLDCDSSFLWSKEPPRRRRSSWRSNIDGRCLPPYSLGGEGGSFHAHDTKDTISASTAGCPSKLDASEDNIEVKPQSRYACASKNCDKLDLTYAIPGSTCNDNMSCSNSMVEKIAMENDTELCSESQPIDSRHLNRRRRLSLNRKNISQTNIHPVSSHVPSEWKAVSPLAVPGLSLNAGAPRSNQSKSRGAGSSSWGDHLADKMNQSVSPVDANIPHTLDDLCSANEKVETLNEGDTVQLSSTYHHRKDPSKFAVNRGRSSLVRCNSSRCRFASSGSITADITCTEKEKIAGRSGHYESGYPDAQCASGSGDSLRRGKMDSASVCGINPARDAQPKRHLITGQRSGIDYKLDHTSLKGEKDAKHNSVSKTIGHQHVNVGTKGVDKVQEMCGQPLPHSRMNESSALQPTVLPRKTRGRMLVRNGCISPLNIARMDRVSSEGNKRVLGSKQGASGDINVPGSSDAFKDGAKLCSEGQNVDKKKGKSVMVDSLVDNVSLTDQSHSLGRRELAFSEGMVGSRHKSGTRDVCVNDLWNRSITDCPSNEISLVSPNEEDQNSLDSLDHVHREIVSGEDRDGLHVNLESDYNGSGNSDLGNRSGKDSIAAVSAMFDIELADGRKSRGRQLMKRQCRSPSFSNHRPHSESSSTSYLGPNVAHLQMPRQPSHVPSARRSRNHHASSIFENVIEIDDSPSPRINGHLCASNADCTIEDDNSARARQMEADELLAWQLQEQFDQEITGIGRTEIDASIAWTLQQEENTGNAPSTLSANQDLPFHRNSATSSVSMPFLLQSSNGSSVWSTSRSRLAQLRTGVSYRSSARHPSTFNFPSNMSLEMRINLLEALDVITGEDGASTVDRLARTDRDFNENDYEMLLALDNDNDRHTGASINQINRLPLSEIQVKDNPGEPCAVCLEIPSAGDHIRHLPCLHKFHKECIDPWLMRRSLCPICKLSISG